jgi:hypothetical protein
MESGLWNFWQDLKTLHDQLIHIRTLGNETGKIFFRKKMAGLIDSQLSLQEEYEAQAVSLQLLGEIFSVFGFIGVVIIVAFILECICSKEMRLKMKEWWYLVWFKLLARMRRLRLFLDV